MIQTKMIRKKLPTRIYFSSIEDSNFSKHWLQKLESYPPSIIKHCLKFIKEVDQQRRFLGYWLLEQHLLDNGLESSLLESILRDKNQKPHFTKCSELNFSLSYSGEIAICAISNHLIGVDIEKINPEINLEHYKTVFSPEAWSAINAADDPISSFFTYWTQMEAVMKADGQGISGATNQVKFGNRKISLYSTERDLIYIPTLKGYIAHGVGNNLNGIIIERKHFRM